MHSYGAAVKPKPDQAVPGWFRLAWERGVMVLRSVVLLVALSAMTGGVLWLRKETPNPRGGVAKREGTVVEARSLKGASKAVTTPSLVTFAVKKDLAQTAASAAAADTEQAPGAWPREVALKEEPSVGEVFQDPKTKAFIYRTKHFEFSCDVPLGPEVVRHFAGAFETTHLLNCLLPLDLKPTPEPTRKLFRACILSTEAAFAAAGGKPGTGGFYSQTDKCLYVPMASLGVKMVGKRVLLDRSIESNNTLIREITHQMMNRWLTLLPVWLTEGAAEYVGAADFVRGRILLGQMQDRLKGRAGEGASRQAGGSEVQLAMLSVPELLELTPKTWAAGRKTPAAAENSVSALLLTFYLYHLDRGGEGAGTIAMLRAVEKGMPHEEAVKQFILAGRSPAQFEGEMGKVFASLGVELSFIRRGTPQ